MDDFCYDHNSPIITCGDRTICMVGWMESRLMGCPFYDAITIDRSEIPSDYWDCADLIFANLPRTVIRTISVKTILRNGQEIRYAEVPLDNLAKAMTGARINLITYMPNEEKQFPGDEDFFLINFKGKLLNSPNNREFVAMIAANDAVDAIQVACRDEIAPD